MNDAVSMFLMVGGGLGMFLLGMKHLVLVELDVLNAYERIRAYYLNIAETLAGGK